jgi:hypothetical protein
LSSTKSKTYNYEKIAPIVALAAIASFASCKKDYTCTCTIGTTTKPYKYTKVKKADAQKSCDALNASASAVGGKCSL